MRALCGAIITAGALIGLGLACVGIGLRYQEFGNILDNNNNPRWVEFKYLDTAFMLAFVILCFVLLIGLGISFLGLAYHHQRRHREFLHRHTQGTGARPADGSAERITV